MSGPSDKATLAARWSFSEVDDIDIALDAAHDSALGLDRSVCLRDVREALLGEALRDELAEAFYDRERRDGRHSTGGGDTLDPSDYYEEADVCLAVLRNRLDRGRELERRATAAHLARSAAAPSQEPVLRAAQMVVETIERGRKDGGGDA